MTAPDATTAANAATAERPPAVPLVLGEPVRAGEVFPAVVERMCRACGCAGGSARMCMGAGEGGGHGGDSGRAPV